MRMKSALVIYYTIVVVVVVGIALVGAVSIGSNMNLVPVAYATDKQYCTHIQDYDEDGTPTIGSSCSGSMKDCRNDSQGIDKCVKDDKFVYS